MRLPSGSGLGQSSVGLVHAVCPHSDGPILGGYGKRLKLMYLYFVPFHHHINLGSTVLYFFFLFFILAAFCSIPQLSPSDAVTFLVIASHRPFFLTIFFIHNLASPCYYPAGTLALLFSVQVMFTCTYTSLCCTIVPHRFHISWALSNVFGAWD